MKSTLQGTNISNWWNRKVTFQTLLGGDRLVPERVQYINIHPFQSGKLQSYFRLLDPQMKLSSSDLLCDGHLGKKVPQTYSLKMVGKSRGRKTHLFHNWKDQLSGPALGVSWRRKSCGKEGVTTWPERNNSSKSPGMSLPIKVFK